MTEPDRPLSFAADEQLGRLSRWLLILGIDVAYRNRWDDRELAATAAREGRVILTRDSRLADKLPGVAVYRVEENYPVHQLREVVGKFFPRLRFELYSRCVECNRRLEPVAKPAVEGRVPPFVWRTQTEFRSCPQCGKIFWAATHVARIERQLAEILGEWWERISAKEGP